MMERDGIMEYWVEEALASLQLHSNFNFSIPIRSLHRSIIPLFQDRA
jgi:hypothetical protein